MNQPPSGSFRSLKDWRPEMVERNTAEAAELVLVSTETEPVGLVTGMDRTGPISPREVGRLHQAQAPHRHVVMICRDKPPSVQMTLVRRFPDGELGKISQELSGRCEVSLRNPLTRRLPWSR
jgi:hypothetical protein